MATIYIDDKPYQVDSRHNLLHACLSLGLDLPYFCWHPAMGSVGSCRQCAVKSYKDEDDKKGRIVMACMEPASEGTRISLNDPEAREMRENVIEWLMTNHPHDCPICDEGGECHLQDMTVMTGHNYRNFRFNKRTYRNQYLGPFINHEMNRCIQCYRCVRFYRDYAGGRDLNAFASRNHVYFGRHEDGVLESVFSGNLVEICPTGVFTDKTLKQHYTRKWDLQAAPSICNQCGLGCNIIAGERYGGLRRIISRFNSKVNGYFICDRGRFGYEYVNSEHRIRQPLQRRMAGEEGDLITKTAALTYLGDLLNNSETKILGIGSPRASLESNFALRKLVGAERFYSGISAREQRLVSAARDILQNSPVRTPSLRETEQADAVLVLGEDLLNTAPMLALALRQAVRTAPLTKLEKLKIPDWHDAAVREALQEDKGPLYLATPGATGMDNLARAVYRAAPADLARLGFAVAHFLDNRAPEVSDLSREMQELAREIAQTLKAAQRPLVVSGTSCGSEALLQAAANIARALHREDRPAELLFTMPESNSLGLALMDPQPLAGALEAVEKGEVDTVIVLENDLYRRAEASRIDRFLGKVKHLIVLDYLVNATTNRAEVLLPAGTFAEADGTLVNNEGRAQRFYEVMLPQETVQASWRWLTELLEVGGKKDRVTWGNLDGLTGVLVQELPLLAGIETLASPPGFAPTGQKIPRQPHRYSGRTAMNAHINVSEPQPPEDPDSPLSFSMEGYRGKPPSQAIPFFWSPGWNSEQSINKYQIEVGGPLHGGDPGRRLLEPSPTPPRNGDYFRDIPQPFQSREDEWLLLPYHAIFGSEELSIHSPPIAERAPRPSLALHPEDARRLEIDAEEEIEFTLDKEVMRQLPVRLDAAVPRGTAGVPAGFPDFVGCDWPIWRKIVKTGDKKSQ